MLERIRFWLIRKLVGNHPLIANVETENVEIETSLGDDDFNFIDSFTFAWDKDGPHGYIRSRLLEDDND